MTKLTDNTCLEWFREQEARCDPKLLAEAKQGLLHQTAIDRERYRKERLERKRNKKHDKLKRLDNQAMSCRNHYHKACAGWRNLAEGTVQDWDPYERDIALLDGFLKEVVLLWGSRELYEELHYLFEKAKRDEEYCDGNFEPEWDWEVKDTSYS